MYQQGRQSCAAAFLCVVGKGLGASSGLSVVCRLLAQGEVFCDLLFQRGALLSGKVLPLNNCLTAEFHGEKRGDHAQTRHGEEQAEGEQPTAADEKRQHRGDDHQRTGEER